MQRMLEESTINVPSEPDPDGLPEGLRPFERQVIRGMRRAAARTAAKERALIVAWIRKQKVASWPDLRDLAEAVISGEHRQNSVFAGIS